MDIGMQMVFTSHGWDGVSDGTVYDASVDYASLALFFIDCFDWVERVRNLHPAEVPRSRACPIRIGSSPIPMARNISSSVRSSPKAQVSCEPRA